METDNPLKMLITAFSQAFAEWLLGGPVRRVRPLNVEFPGTVTSGDLIFAVEMGDGQSVLLHIELQGRRSHAPMSFRELDYMTRLILREAGNETPDKAPRLQSVVLYIGQGAGREDSGRYEILGLDSEPCLIWRYTPIRLWQMDADELLTLGSTAFLPLVGQTQMREPAQVIPAVVESIHKVADELQRRRLMTALVNLISDEEIIAMIEQMIDPTDEYFMDLPYMRRMRQKAREEALAEGVAEGASRGRVEGILLGQQEGILEGLRAAVLNVLVLRFNPPSRTYLQCQRQLQAYTEQESLQQLLAAAVQSEDMDAFVLQLGAEQANGHQ
ncbi:MAG: hypothetical protein KJZ86_15685 [Caldilineaceae bacterium]|nr:hypothetical protein [Caldilineaceae bacterium]HRJ43181.1 hypothetical protein [Caldilineaceae bacterium]